jgi:hypothetical protein
MLNVVISSSNSSIDSVGDGPKAYISLWLKPGLIAIRLKPPQARGLTILGA